MRRGDVVVAYQATPERRILGLIQLKSDGKVEKIGGSFCLNPRAFVELDTPVKLSAVRQVPGAPTYIDFTRFKRPQGTVFRITQKGGELLLGLIRKYNPRQQEEISRLFEQSKNMFSARDMRTDSGPYITTGERESKTTHRIGQGQIRKAALERYGNQCCLCKIDDPSLLVAGHIRGWARGEKARNDPENVVLMCALHDSLFGKGLMTLAPSRYTVELSPLLSVEAKKQIEGTTLKFRPPKSGLPSKQYLDWHRKNLFRGSSLH